ncbi:hypothetical protein B0J18DRAFT_130182 [Chaetomium sp. MPI-SDFR-AT-0129]|nr:hypothetical protein B0J18DRAFT_130182 [Chaetomium sp. MPI-SDFR-AT-0129]
MTDAPAAAEATEPAKADQTDAADATAATPTAADKANKARRKSIGSTPAKGKKLNKKASKPRLLHLDAQPGDHFFVKLKGFPQWPVIICDEDMLPASLLKTRPVTAKRADGTYREDYADGGKNAADRTFPIMYLQTNEFGWISNTLLTDLDPTTILQDVKVDKMKGALKGAHQLASENHPLSYYKEVLQNYQEELIEQEKAKAARAATPKGKKAKAASADEDEDVEMEDAPEATETPAKGKKAKKRKAEDSAETPQRTESAKKPKIKLTTSATPKANGAASTPKATKGEGKSAKTKSKKKDAEETVEEAAKEPELSAEEKHVRKSKEVLFLRHKIQKGLLTRDQEPKEEEMKLMSDYITKLEAFPDLEVSIIRATKINKVLKAILKLDNIPKEDEFKFKPRSQVLLDKWNKLLAVDGTPAPAGETNGTGKAKANGVKEKSEPAESGEEGKEDKEEKKAAKEKSEEKAETEKPAEEKTAEAVEATA